MELGHEIEHVIIPLHSTVEQTVQNLAPKYMSRLVKLIHAPSTEGTLIAIIFTVYFIVWWWHKKG